VKQSFYAFVNCILGAETFTADMDKHKGGGNRQTRSSKTLKETKKEDKEEGRDCSQPTKGKKRD
jgi:hypothetical protein